MTDNTTSPTNTGKAPSMIPIRCSVCGKNLATIYSGTQPGKIYATCCCGHKISYPSEDFHRKAV